MMIKITLTAATLAASLLGALSFVAPARANDDRSGARLAMSECAGGYHPDADGTCQPDGGATDIRPCPAGMVATPWPNGQSYRCISYRG